MNHNQLAAEIHQQNVDAGWWTSLETKMPITPLFGEKGLVLHRRNIGEIFALIHSELSEGYEGNLFEKPDQHLPKYSNYHIEVADAAIRLYDLAGAYKVYIPDNIEDFNLDDEEIVLLQQYNLGASNALASRAFEGFRKNDMEKAFRYIAMTILHLYEFAEYWDIHLSFYIAEKRKYNQDRQDHKIENRLKPDGKKC